MTAEYTYLGAEERIYSGYLNANADGAVSTLIGTPGMSPVVVVRAAGNEHLREIPADGLWTAADQPVEDTAAPAAEDESPSKPAKTVKVVTS